ncbi:MAG TPA: hypothetical protein VKX49_07215 [Bryobacteraceae bacterium]|nr:hypothetical protein [Bryobacteraceae bacterium]
MNALDQINAYLRRLEGRLRLFAFSKGTSLVTVSALLVTVLLVWITNRYAFSASSLVVARILLFLSVGTAIAFGLVIPLLGLNRRSAARRAEQKFPDFQERLLTVAEKENTNDPFVQLLASDAMRVAHDKDPDRLASTGSIFGLLTSAGVAVAVLLWLILAGPGYLGYGTSLLWAGAPKSGNTRAFYDIIVKPGDRTVRRKADQLVTAQLMGFEFPKVRLFARYAGTSKWEPVDMLPSPGAPTYEFLFSGLATNVEYYVEAGAVQSKHFNLRVIDMPAIKKIRVTYHYPAWTGMKDAVEDPGGDLRAVEGTEAEVAIQTDRPLSKGMLMVNDNQQIELKGGEGNWLTARVPINKDGMYHVAALEQGENVRMTEDFFIEARKALAPTVRIDRPGRDARVNPVEEVTVTVNGAADFGLSDMSLHYSVNGAPEKTVSLLNQKGAKTAEGKYLIALEDYKLSPGDLVTIYATAKDARNTSKTDMYFIQADPFERNYSQSQEAGGGGGGGGGGADPTGEISQRQKDIIAATWNEQKSGAKNATQAADDAKFLADQEEKLAQQALSLANRMKARELADANSQFKNFATEMESAAKAMSESAQKIRTQKWPDAIPPEQQGLQHALRAESMFRDIQVAFGSRGGGGGGGGMGRDLQNLADLELDREKNQYETGRQSASDQRAKDVDQALQKLQELARRQQELAQQQRNQQQAFQQRWEQEMLRREAEELKRQMEQLSQQSQQQQGNQQSSQQWGQQSGQQANGQQSANGQPGRQGSSGQSGSSSNPQLQQAIERLQRATDDMRNAENQQNGSPEQTRLNQERAAKGLQESRDILNGMQNQNAGGQLDSMVQQANQLAQQQSDFQNRLRRMLGGNDPNQQERQARSMAQEGQQMADQLKQIEKQMSDTAHSLAGAQNPVGNKLRDALSEAQQTELEMNMRRNAQWIGQGYGPQVWVRESTVTAGVNQLRDKLQEAQSALAQNGQPGKQPGVGDKGDLEKALAQVEAARSRLEQALRARDQNGQRGDGRNGNQRGPGQQQGQQQGQQPGGQQPGQAQAQNGQPGGQQPGGQQPGQQSGGQQAGGQQPGNQQGGQQAGGQQGGQPGQQGGGFGGNNGGAWNGGAWGGPYGGPGPVQPYNGWVPIDQGYRESQRDLNALRDFMRNNPDFASDYLNLMHAMNGAYQDKGELEGRISREVLPNMERLELELRRKLDEKNADQVRSAGTETIPPGYSNAVADYFRKLSKGK